MPEIYTAIDVETTGLDHETDHITEIAAIRFSIEDNGSIREIGRFQTFVSGGVAYTIPPEITELTGIQAADLVGAPGTYAAIEALDIFSHGTTLVAHNLPFDLAFLAHGSDDDFGYEDYVCTRALAKMTEPDKSAKLADVCGRYNVPLYGHHRAMNDVEATVKAFVTLRSKAEAAGIDYRNVVVDSPDRPLRWTPWFARIVTITKEAV